MPKHCLHDLLPPSKSLLNLEIPNTVTLQVGNYNLYKTSCCVIRNLFDTVYINMFVFFVFSCLFLILLYFLLFSWRSSVLLVKGLLTYV